MDRREDFLALFLRHQDDVRAFIGSMIRAADAREDVFQETALTLWREFDRYDPARSFGAWARGVAANKVLQRWDRDRRLPAAFPPEVVQAVLDAYDRTDGTGGPDALRTGDHTADRAEALRECVGRLPDKSRGLLALRYERGLTLADTAAVVGSTLDAVHKALSRMRERLAECVRLRLAQEAHRT
jgi:RNA polymerase sigma-70 factor (ECF subfamily)